MKKQFLLVIVILFAVTSGINGQCTAGDITGSTSVCVGSTITLTAAPSGGTAPYNVTWLSSDESKATISSAGVVTGENPGSVDITYTFSDNADPECSGGPSGIFQVTVTSIPAAAGTISGSPTVCKNTSGTYSIGAIPGADSYIWTVPTGATISGDATGNSVTVDFSDTAVDGDITVKGTNSCGDGTPSSLSLTIGSLPDAAGPITGTSPVCQGSTGKTFSVGPIAGATGYTWTLPAGASIASGSGTESITVDFSGAAVSGDVTVKGSNDCGEGTSSSFTVVVNPLPSAAGIMTGTSALCQGTTGVVFSVPSISNTDEYIWSVPAGATITSIPPLTESITVDFSASAVSGTVSVFGRNTCGDGAGSGFAVTVNPLPTLLSAAQQPIDACSGSPAVIHLTGLLPNSVSTIGYSIAGTPHTVTGVTANDSGVANFSTVDLTTGNNGQTLLVTSVQVTSASPNCSGTFSFSVTLSVKGLPTLGTVSNGGGVCEGIGAEITLTGLISNSVSDIDYDINGVTHSKLGVSADNTGNATFTSFPLTTGNNGKDLNINTITNTLTGCVKSGFTQHTTLTSDARTSPVVTAASGSFNVCAGSTGNVYSTTKNMFNYVWAVTGGTITAGQTTKSVTVTWNTPGTGSITVSYDNGNGCTGTSSVQSVDIFENPSPVISGNASACLNSTGNLYSTQPGMLSYTWTVSSGGAITTAEPRGNTISVNWTSTGTKTLTVSFQTPTGCTTAAGNLSVQVKPSISDLSVTFSPDPEVGATMHATYHYTNGTTGDGTGCTFRWFRDGEVISSATGIDYIAQSADLNKVLTVEVTPVSTVCAEYSGIPVLSDPTPPIENLDSPDATPYVTLVCIEGIREAGKTLTGKYEYHCIKPEGASVYRWITVDSLTREVAEIGTGKTHVLIATDIGTDKEIYFEVTPVTSNYHPITGIAKRSKPLAKIFGLKDQYSIVEADAALTSNVLGGSFTGNGIISTPTQVYFSPSRAGEGDHTITYLMFYDNTSFTCSQRSPQLVNVDPDIPQFSTVDAVYCHDASSFNVDVSNINVGSFNNDFILEGPKGIYSDGITIQYFGPDMTGRIDNIIIDPYSLVPGRNKLTYRYQLQKVIFDIFGMPRIFILTYSNSVEFIVDYVSEYIKFINLGTKYCKSAEDVYISVEGISPYEGTPHWTGSYLSEKHVNSAVFSPWKGKIDSTYILSYHYESPLGCLSQTLNASVTINSMPQAGFALAPSYNVDGPYQKLLPVQWGGEFTGRGVSGGILFPDIAGVGKDTITYKITDINRCTNTLDQYTMIRKAEGLISGINDVVCYDTPVHTITATSLPVTGVVQTYGFNDTRHTITQVPGSSSATFDARLTGVGFDTIFFSYRWDGVDYRISRIVEVENLGNVIIYDLTQDQRICDDTAAFELKVSKTGGVFTGPVYNDPVDHKNYFNPKTGAVNDVVTYTFTSPKGCSVDTSISVHVYKAPLVDFAPVDLCIDNSTDVTMFNNLTTHEDPVVEWKWEFTDESSTGKSSLENAGYLYLKGGLQKASLTAVTDKGCRVTEEKTFTLARKPVADFYWKKDCFHPDSPNDSLLLFDATTYTTVPKDYIWIKEGDALQKTGLTESYGKPATGYMRITHIVTTNTAGCYDAVVKDIYIRPSYNIPPDGKFEDFESGNGGWVKSDASSIWSFGMPTGTVLKSAASGNNAWFTAAPENDTASVESPCYDFSNLTRPLIKMKLQKALDKERDGVALQYRVGDEWKWHTVGTLNDGIGWYNSATISGEPGGSQVGWTSQGAFDTQYQNASHTLDELINKKDVVFRMTYGSDGSRVAHDGFIFDDLFIGDRTRYVLIEHFMNLADVKSSEVKSLVDTIAEHKKLDVINIQYHANFPGNDLYYAGNPGEINARILYYGLTRVPFTFIDGGNDPKMHAMVFDHYNTEIDSNAITKRSLVSSPFIISLDPDVNGRLLTVKGNVKAVEKLESANLSLFLAITEKKNTDGGTSFLNIFRKFIPDAGGVILKNNWNPGDVETINQTWTIDKSLDAASIEIIAFLQNRITQQVYQAFSVIKPKIAVGIDDQLLHGRDYIIYPNPASDIITVEFGSQLTGNAIIRIYGIGGEILREYKAGAGSTQFTIEDPGLKGGIYMMRVIQGKTDFGYRKLIITD